MLFSKKKTAKPSIADEKEFVLWVLKNLDAPDMKMIRRLFPRKNLDSAINSMANSIMESLREHEGKEKLMDFLVSVHEGYMEFMGLIDKRGGLWRSPQQIQVAFCQILSKMVTLPYFIKYKYGVDLPLWDLKLPDYEDL